MSNCFHYFKSFSISAFVWLLASGCNRQSPPIEPPQANKVSRSSTLERPAVPYWHVWTDENGVSHQSRCEVAAFELRSISPGAAPEWIDNLGSSGATMLVVVQPVGWVGEWHENPKPQWIIPLSGRWFVETMDGTRVELGSGPIPFTLQ